MIHVRESISRGYSLPDCSSASTHFHLCRRVCVCLWNVLFRVCVHDLLTAVPNPFPLRPCLHLLSRAIPSQVCGYCRPGELLRSDHREWQVSACVCVWVTVSYGCLQVPQKSPPHPESDSRDASKVLAQPPNITWANTHLTLHTHTHISSLFHCRDHHLSVQPCFLHLQLVMTVSLLLMLLVWLYMCGVYMLQCLWALVGADAMFDSRRCTVCSVRFMYNNNNVYFL